LAAENPVYGRLRNTEALCEGDFALLRGLLDLDKQFAWGTQVHGLTRTVIHLHAIYTMMNSFVNPLLNDELSTCYSRADNPRMNLATNLDEATKARGYKSQSALGRAAGVPQPTINRILGGTTPTPDLTTLQKLADALDVDVEWLTTRTGAGPNSSNRARKSLLSEGVSRLVERMIELERRQPETAAKLLLVFEQQLSLVSQGSSMHPDRGAHDPLQKPESEAQELLSRVREPGATNAAAIHRKSRRKS
jgi:transcriptional regulator with XRE-family HTH domain